MSIVSRDEVAEVFDRVEAWPEDARRDLAEMILESLTHPRKVEPKPRKSLADLVGLLKTDGPPPTDEEVAQMLDDELMRRYGS
jgi:hypothetical protein